MPSTKTIAVAVVALAATGTQANACNPVPTCDEYNLNPEADADCRVTGDAKDGGIIIASSYLEDCVKSCYDYRSFKCELISFEASETPSEKGSCTLYPDAEITRRPRGGEKTYYSPKCFECNSRGRGGRGGRNRGRIRRS
ncbi:hypothetical protein DER45DRAFT_569526 [Fusarium avenaceum]|nr:hypothetical protein DER45DRAFT_569526 [Fusarium avenaceum]